jgi:mannose-6-phosphate isomerase-like protein (cupin superfamily)
MWVRGAGPALGGRIRFLQGEVTYHAEGKPDQVAKAGGGFAQGRATTHRAENTGTVPAVWIAVDIPLP